jgi:uncharacterized membrane protein YtjA (UPF0391 family)
VEVAEKVEDKDDWEGNSNQPEKQSAAHGGLLRDRQAKERPAKAPVPTTAQGGCKVRRRNPGQPAGFLKRRSSFVRAADNHWRLHMGNLLHYALIFLVVALIAAAVGFGGVAGFAMEAARLLFWVFIVLFVVSLVAGLVRRA